MRRSLILVFLGALLIFGTKSEASIQYFDKAAFLAQTGATAATGPLPDAGAVPAGFTVGSVSFTTLSGQLFMGTGGLFPGVVTDWSAALPGNDIAISDVESFRVDLASPAFSLGFDIWEPKTFSTMFPVTDDCFAPCFDTTFRINVYKGGSLLSGGSILIDAGLKPSGSPLGPFFGLWMNSSFDRVDIIDVTNTIDNEYFGQFYAGKTAPFPGVPEVPEPTAILLFASGLGGVAFRRRRS
jgi:hypothetical protein